MVAVRSQPSPTHKTFMLWSLDTHTETHTSTHILVTFNSVREREREREREMRGSLRERGMNDHLISNEVVVVVVMQASGESIILDQLHLCSICGLAKEKKLDEEKSKHEVVWLNKTVLGPCICFPHDGYLGS